MRMSLFHDAKTQLSNVILVRKWMKRQWNGNKSNFEEVVTEHQSQHLQMFKEPTDLHRVCFGSKHFNDWRSLIVMQSLL